MRTNPLQSVPSLHVLGGVALHRHPHRKDRLMPATPRGRAWVLLWTLLLLVLSSLILDSFHIAPRHPFRHEVRAYPLPASRDGSDTAPALPSSGTPRGRG